MKKHTSHHMERERERGSEIICCNNQTIMLTPLRTMFRRPSNAVELMQQRCSEARDPPQVALKGHRLPIVLRMCRVSRSHFSSGGAGESETNVFVSSCCGCAESAVHIFRLEVLGSQKQVCSCLRAVVWLVAQKDQQSQPFTFFRPEV